ncbi:MAG: hypothetical protein LBT33_08180 [Spirochaetia bacterium]|jgi:hypothetical protein|nr:hypothetical protein [Spirochaetia bacterium]
MGYGLGKDSPVVLTLGKENYESLLLRHGQWIRWRVAEKCPCAVRDNMQPDPHCGRCAGLGLTYTWQKKRIVTQTVFVPDTSGIIEVLDEYEDCGLDFIHSFDGFVYPHADKAGKYISLNTPNPPQKGAYLYAVMVQDSLKKVSAANCADAGGGYYRVEGLQSRRSGIDGLYHAAPGDIVRIGSIVDGGGASHVPDEFRLDMFHVTPAGQGPIEPPVTATDIEYVPPYLFALLSQDLFGNDKTAVERAGGDGILTFPYNCDVSGDDVLTVFSGTYTQKEVVKRIEDADDTISAYFVQEVVSCTGLQREFVKGKDYLLIGTNRVRWLCEDAPTVGEAYSISYRICPTYRVIKDIPQIRTGENQRLPKKVVVKLYGTYGEKRGVNRQ